MARLDAALLQVLLVILFGAPEGARLCDLGGDWALELAAGVKRLLRFLCGGFLLRRMKENRGAVLLAEVRPLAIHLRRIVNAPESVQQLRVGNFLRIKGYLDDFGVAGGVRAHVFVCRIFLVPALVPGDGLDDSRHATKRRFNSPKTTCCKRCDFLHSLLPYYGICR